MSAIHQVLLAGSGASYQIQNSLRFRASNSAYLSRTSGASPTAQTKVTYSTWMKAVPSLASTNQVTFISSSGNNGLIGWNNAAGAGRLFIRSDSANDIQFTGLFRDPSAWGHLVVAIDTTQATSSDRVKVYWNGTAMTYTSGTYPSLNSNTYLNAASTAYRIMQDTVNGWYLDGYIANFYMIDGQALTPSSFGQTDATTGVWAPKAYSGTFGTNGFFLQFKDATSTTTIGYDTSGNSNNWTTSGISVTSGVTFDQMLDTPTNNYCVLNPLDRYQVTLSNANMSMSVGNAYPNNVRSTVTLSSGKWYWEALVNSGSGTYNHSFSITKDSFSVSGGTYSNSSNPGAGWTWDSASDNSIYVNNSLVTNTLSKPAANDIVMMAYDADSGKVWFGLNGTWNNSGNPSGGTNQSGTVSSGSMTPTLTAYGTSNNGFSVNFGQRAFSYTPPSGFKALNTANLSVPSIKKPSLYMDATLRTGTGATASVSSLGFQPDLVWIKSRSAATNNNLFDSARGATIGLVSQNANAEYTDANSLTAFNSNGYSLGSDASSRGVNINTNTYVDWAWKEGAAPGFDIVTYTGNGANRTVSHALGAAPACYVVKYRSGSNADEWFMYHKALGATKYIRWSQALGSFAGSTYWQDTAPTSSVFSIGTNTAVNTNTSLYVAYLWSEIDGFSKFGSYTGNASSDGPFVFCGFRPRWIYIKGDNATSGRQYDTARLTNEAKSPLYFNAANAESAEANGIDILSNGFKVRWSDSVINGSGTTYIFMAFAEAPFKYARAR